jgi:hypothetical protein
MASRVRRIAVLSLLVVAAAGAVAPGPVAAKDGDVIRTGSCSGASDWKLKLSPENGRIEVEFEVDTPRVGQAWTVKLRHDGTRFFLGTRTTQAPSGSFEVRRVRNNTAGADFFVGRAVNQSTGEVCGGTATF